MIEEEEKGVTAIFQTEGYRPLSQIQHLPTEEVFQIFGQLLQQMENNERHYLTPERYLISEDTVYIHPLKNKVKLIFDLNEEAIPAREQLSQLTTYCQSMVSEEGQSYLMGFAEELKQASLSYRSAIHRCDMMQQEIYVCDIP